VYVVSDPNHEANAGAVKVLSLDEDAYQALITQINAAQGTNTPIWNNDACDLFFTWGKVEKVSHEGKPNEYRFKKNGFTRIGFTTSPKHLDSLTDELVDDAQFDANWYTIPTKEDLEAFYLENCSSSNVSNDDIPMDIPPVAAAPKAHAATKDPVVGDPVVGDPIAKDVTEDVDDIPAPAPAPKPAAKSAAKPAAKPAAAADPAPAAPAEDINKKIDDILAGMSL